MGKSRVAPAKAIAVQPVSAPRIGLVTSSPETSASSAPVRRRVTAWQRAGAVYAWLTWLFIVSMVLCQLVGVVWDSSSFDIVMDYGVEPQLGSYQVPGTSDMPYRDRLLACYPKGLGYIPVRLSDALANSQLSILDTSSPSHVGYRVVHRSDGPAMDSSTVASYSHTCSAIARTLDGIFETCSSLGYNVTRDQLRIVDGVDSHTTRLLLESLPVLVMPVADNSPLAKYMIPGWDGISCSFSLAHQYVDSSQSQPLLIGVNRTVREQKTQQWLGRSGGTWRNGWYEDLTEDRWFADYISTGASEFAHFGIDGRFFDTQQRRELHCGHSESQSACVDPPTVTSWGRKFSTSDLLTATITLSAGNATHFGLFWYHSLGRRTVRCLYDWETLLSNLTVALQLGRWMVSMLALHSGYFYHDSEWLNAGIGCLANSPTFVYFPLTILPRLRMALAAFWTVGCQFEGNQEALADAWFAMYPAIVELMLLYFSLLNTAAKVLRRRMSDVLFAPTIVFFCGLHLLRDEIASRHWFGINGRVTTAVFSDEVDRLALLDFFSSDMALRMNGNILGLFQLKVGVLALGLLPLVFARSFPIVKSPENRESSGLEGVERSLAVRAGHVGGLGCSGIYVSQPKRALNSYELLRLGYLVFDDTCLLSFDDWDVLSMLVPLRKVHHLWNYRVLVFELEPKRADHQARAISGPPQLLRLDDQRLVRPPFWKISACAVEC